MALVDVLKWDLIDKEEKPVAPASLQKDDSVVGLYFSAHWCPPCRAFTPELAKWYNSFKKTDKGEQFEVVFVSSDKDEDSYKEYFKDMPWLALPYNEREAKGKLSKKYSIEGIPTLVLLDGKTGKMITKDGRSIVMDDKEGKDFPWIPKKFPELMGDKPLLNKAGEEVKWASIEDEVVGLYFSAHWCGPCRGFTPQLIKTYENVRATGKSFQIVFVSSDRDEAAMKEYYNSMPWLTLPFGDPRKKTLSRLFDISGIPTLVLLNKDGSLITENGRTAVSSDPDGKEFPWHPKPVNELTGATADDINNIPCLIWFCLDKDKGEAAGKVLEEIAIPYKEKVKKEECKNVGFLYHNGEDEDDIGSSLKSFVGIQPSKEVLVFVNIPGQEVFEKEAPIDAATVKDIWEKYNASTLEFRPLKQQ